MCVLVAQSYPALCNPTDCSPPDFSVHGILQARILEWIAIPFSRGTSQPSDWTLVSCMVGRFFTVWATGKFLGAVQALIKAMGRTLIQLSCVSWVNLCKCLLIMSLALSAFPEDWGLQEQCKWYSIPRVLDTPWVTAALKAEPLSPRSLCGSPNLGIISWITIFITSLACSLQQGKASIQPVKVSTQTCKQEYPLAFGIWVKSISQSSPGYFPLYCNPDFASFSVFVLFFWQTSHLLIMLFKVFITFLPSNKREAIW